MGDRVKVVTKPSARDVRAPRDRKRHVGGGNKVGPRGGEFDGAQSAQADPLSFADAMTSA